MQKSSSVAFLMIHGPRSKKTSVGENLNKQIGKLSKTSPTGRLPPALLCCAATHVGEASSK